jgi:hypothetical protein
MLLELRGLHLVHHRVEGPRKERERILIVLKDLFHCGFLYLFISYDWLDGGVGVVGQQLVYGLDGHFIGVIL